MNVIFTFYVEAIATQCPARESLDVYLCCVAYAWETTINKTTSHAIGMNTVSTFTDDHSPDDT